MTSDVIQFKSGVATFKSQCINHSVKLSHQKLFCQRSRVFRKLIKSLKSRFEFVLAALKQI